MKKLLFLFEWVQSRYVEGSRKMKIDVLSRERMQLLFVKAKPFLGVIFLQLAVSGLDIICKAALNEGMSNYVLIVYRHAIATVFITPFALALDK